MSQKSEKQTYPGGFQSIVELMEKRMDPMVYAKGEALPPLDADLSAFKSRIIDPSAPELKSSRSTFARKYRELAKEFSGQPALLHLHGLLIANLRRKGQPEQTAALFSRLWAEEAAFLLDHLDTRWLVSAVTTFGDHGLTPGTRQLGQALSVMFGMMKLYETERLYSGHAPDQAFAPKDRSAKTLAMQMDAYSLTGGGLDVNLLGGLWQQAENEPVLRPLAQRLLELLVEDDKTVFRRLRTMRQKRLKILKKKGVRHPSGRRSCVVDVPVDLIKPADQVQTWGTVTLAKAPLAQIAAFAAYHLDLGAHQVLIYLDAPDGAAEQFLSLNPKVRVIPCDDTYWAAQKKPRMKAHQMRQAWVATQAYQHAKVDWLAHLDIDEFLLPPDNGPNAMQALLGTASPSDAALHLPPAEMLAGSQGDELFKLLPDYGTVDPFPAEDVYPNFGTSLPHGFVSHRSGKNIARTGLDSIRLGIHEMLYDGRVITNRRHPTGAFVGHAHATSWAAFRDKLDFRLNRGSYRKSDDEKLQLSDILGFMQQESGEDGLRQFFSEVCEATPELTQALDNHGLLLRRRLDLNTKIARHFGPLPDGSGELW